MKLLGVVVSYYPDEETVEKVSSYLDHLDTLIIWENTPSHDLHRYKLVFSQEKGNIIYMGTGKNVGIGKALNEAVEYGRKHNFTHLLTMDQDSSFEEGDFKLYKDTINRIDDPKCMAFRVGDGNEHTEEYTYATGFITSGTMHPLAVFDKLGLFRDDFFIDAIDCEFSSRMKRNGYSIIQINRVHMNHNLGYPLAYSFMGKKRWTPDYSAFRTYYLSRNYFVLNKLYTKAEYEGFIWFLKSYCFWRPIAILCVEKDKIKKIKAIIIGVYHGLLGRTGEYTIK